MTIKAVGFYEYGSPENLEIVELPDPRLEPGEALVRVHAATINPTDTSFRSGHHADRLERVKPPYVPGVELAGEVVAIHPGAELLGTVEPGQKVLGYVSPYSHGGGACAEYVPVDVRSLVKVPTGMDFVHAATLPMNGVTALVALDLLSLPPGGSLLVTGGAGALGSYVIAIANHFGFDVLADGYEKDRGFLESVGARVIPRGPEMAQAVREAFPGGVDGILDGACIGTSLVPLIREGGAYAPVRGDDFAIGEAKVRVTPVHAREQLHNTGMLRQVVDLAEKGVLRTRVSRVIGMDDVADAHALLEQGGVRGRQVLSMMP